MKRILAIVCIFILLLFTGMPMFTSILLCNQYVAYAYEEDTSMSDKEKVTSAFIAYCNKRNAFIKGSENQLTATMAAMCLDSYFLIYAQAHDSGLLLTKGFEQLASSVKVMKNPLFWEMYSPAVKYFNFVINQMKSEGLIPNASDGLANTSDGLFNGSSIGGNLIYIYDSDDSIDVPANKVIVGSPVNGYDYTNLLSAVKTANPNFDFSNNSSQGYTAPSITCTYAADVVETFSLNLSYGNNYRLEYNPCIVRGSAILYTEKKPVYGNTCWLRSKSSSASSLKAGVVSHNAYNNTYTFVSLHSYKRNDTVPASVNFDSNNFDNNDITPPSGSDGLTFTPHETGTGNTFNTYNNYLTKYYNKETYVTTPSDPGGGGGGDYPGSGGEDPTPGGTTPPWDGSGSDGLYSQGGTLTPDGNGGYNLNFPDVGLPDLNIDWSINGLKDKFPFSIPWDLMAFFTVMNAEPETPEIQATIPLGLWEWEIDWDLHQFDSLAAILRNLEFIGFCIGLIVVTRSIIKG